MALGRAGRQTARLAVGAWLALVCLALCVPAALAAEGDYLESFGPDGTAATEFGRPAALAVDQQTGAVYVGDSETQVLYKFDADGTPLEYGGSSPYISGNEITGLDMNEGDPGTAEVAVDPNSHVLYVTSGNKVRAFEANGEPHEFTEGPGAGTSEIPGAIELYGVAVDSSGRIYASDVEGEEVRIYSSTGKLITEFHTTLPGAGSVRPGNLAVAPDGTLYVTNFGFPVVAFEPTKFPVTAKTSYGVGQEVNSDSKRSSSVAVDPATQYVYIGEFCNEFLACETRVSVYDELGNFVGAIGAEGPGSLEGFFPAGLGVNGNTKKLYGVISGEGVRPSQVSVYETLQPPPGPPAILGTTVTDVTSSSAVLRARINPNTFETTYWFEYGLVDCAVSPDGCTKVPDPGGSAGNGHLPTAVSAAISGLSPGTKYFYRVVVENSASAGPEAGPTRTFTTQAGIFGSHLSDHRVWEQVTPANKFGGGITNAGLLQAAQDGSGLAFLTRGSIVEDPDGNRALEPSSVLARRTGSAWTVNDLVPPHTEAGGLGFGPEFKLFSHDLGRAVLEPRDNTPLSPEASERAPNLRINTVPPTYRPLVTSKEGFANVPAGTVFGGEANGERNPVAVSGANGTLSRVVVSSKGPLEEDAEPYGLYMWNDGDGLLEPVSVLPGGVHAVMGQLGSGPISVRHAVSEDGSRVFWAPGDPTGAPTLNWPALYLRDTGANETVRIDVPEEGFSGSGEEHPVFMAASADGSVVFFTDSQQLTEDASPEGRDLYRCEIGEVSGSLGCTDIEDLSAPLSGSGESANAEELAVGVSEDGGSIYFVARAVLDGEPNQADEFAESGRPNLYLWQKGEGARFIATLSGEDKPDWGDPPNAPVAYASHGTATSSPDGRFLVFMSKENLGGVESANPESGQPVQQAFRYDSVEDQLLCISCNPNGSTDSGKTSASDNGIIFPDPQGVWAGQKVGATLPEPAEGETTVGLTHYWPRAVLDNGRTYFNSVSPLVTGDSNGNWDVYQYEPFGLGDCDSSAGSGMVATTVSGCISLISSGTDSQPSVFMDASESGDDVFFATFARLSALDTDTAADVYDARVNGVAAVAEQHPECAGEACQQRTAPPGNVAPNSSSFNGAGNVKQKPHKHCKKGQRKVKHQGKVKCVKKKKSAHHGKKGGSR